MSERNDNTGASGADNSTTTKTADELRKGDYVIFEGRPYQIVRHLFTNCTRPKVEIVMIDIFTREQCKRELETLALVQILAVRQDDYQVINLDDGLLTLPAREGDGKNDVKLPEGDLGTEIQEAFEKGKNVVVTIISAMGEEGVAKYKTVAKKYKTVAKT